MTRDPYTTATWFMWIALPSTAFNYWHNWEQLPTRMATHFDARGHPNGWTTPQGSLSFALGFTLFFVVVFTLASYLVRARKPGSAWPVLIVSYLVLGAFWWGSNWLVWRNLPSG